MQKDYTVVDTHDVKENEIYSTLRKALLDWPGISDGCKTLLMQGLGHKEGCWSSNMQYYINRNMRGHQYIADVLKELESKGFLTRLRIRRVQNKQIIGATAWIFTDNIAGLERGYKKLVEMLAKDGLEPAGKPYSKVDFSFYIEGYKNLKKNDSEMLTTIYYEAMECYSKLTGEETKKPLKMERTRPPKSNSYIKEPLNTEIPNLGEYPRNKPNGLINPINQQTKRTDNKLSVQDSPNPSPSSLIDPTVLEILTHWNELSNSASFTKHTIDPNNKTIRGIHTSIKRMLKGTRIDSTRFSNFVKRYDIPKELLHKKWGINEIKETITKFSKYPMNKKVGLNDFLWNDFAINKTGMSFFFLVETIESFKPMYKNSAKKLSKIVDKDLSIFDLLKWCKEFQYGIEMENHDPETINRLLTWYKDHFADTYTPKAYTPEKFFYKKDQIENAKARIMKNEASTSENTQVKVDPLTLVISEFESDKVPNRSNIYVMQIRDTWKEIIENFRITSEDKPILAENIVKMIKSFREQSTAYKKERPLRKLTYKKAPGRLIEMYSDWLKRNDWITVTVHLYDVNHKLFKRFINEFNEDDNSGYSAITGAPIQSYTPRKQNYTEARY